MRLLTREENKKFIEECLSRNKCYYVWPHKSNRYSGKDLPNAMYPRTYDCSGFVTASLFSAGICDWRATHNAQRLADNCDAVEREDILPGDLLFYGGGQSAISHVMVYVGSVAGKGMKVMGASGGWSKTLTPEIAKQQNAMVVKYKSIDYRQDFVSAGRLRVR
jgi:hypothetical protein